MHKCRFGFVCVKFVYYVYTCETVCIFHFIKLIVCRLVGLLIRFILLLLLINVPKFPWRNYANFSLVQFWLSLCDGWLCSYMKSDKTMTTEWTSMFLLPPFSVGLEDDGSEPSHERSDASEPDPAGAPVPSAVPVRPGSRSGLHHVCRHPGNHIPGNRQLQENRQAASSPQGS